MKRFLSLMVLLLMMTATSFAQNREITGKVIESDTKSAVSQTTVQLLKSDSSFVGGTVTSNNGSFKVEAPKNGRYIVKISYVGYKTKYKALNITSNDNIALGTLTLSPDAIMLKGATITANLAKVQVKEDTFIYNADAYRIPEGSVLEELVKKLPGATVSDDGTIKINGKEVKKILVEGKEFFTGDTKTAMKNIPTSIVNKIKAYDQKSDLAKVTGIDDGEEQTVLDIGVKQGMKKGMFTNNDLGIGTDNRYSARLMGARFSDKLRIMGFGNANNTNDMGFPGGGGGRFGGGRQGLNASKMFGVNFNYDDNKKFQLDGSVRWNHKDADAQTKSSTENFVSTTGSFTNSKNNNMSRSNSWNANMRMEWKPDTMTNIMFRPSFSYSTSDSYSTSESGAFNADPYKYSTDPLGEIGSMEDSLRVNHRKDASISYSDSKSFGGEFQYNRKLNSMGRNVTLRATGNYGEGNSKSLSTSNVELYHGSYLNTDTTYQTNRFNVTPTKNWNYSVQATYSEPIMKATFLQFSYQFQYKYSKSDRATYSFDNLGDSFFDGISPVYGGWGSYLSKLANPYTDYVDESLSRYSEYKNYIHDIQLMLRVIRTKYNFNLGVRVIPQSSHFTQDYQGVHTDTTRNVTNVTPTMDFRYKFSKTSQLRVNYRGETSQPSMTDLLDITDDSDPLNITKGNPGLKPSFTNSLRIFYNNYLQSHQRAIYANMTASTTSNSISDMVTYNATTGGRTTQPQNINGNWNINGTLMYNMAVDTAGYWNVSTFTNYGYTNSVGYYYDSSLETPASVKNTTKTTSVSERLTGGYRNDWFEFELNGNVSYNHSRNMLQSTNDLDTWQFSYGASTNVTLPWGTTVATDLSMSSRRGYNDASMNTNELVWNAQLSQGFLSGKPLTVSLQFYDILKNQSNYSRTINAMMRSDVEYNSITSYAMLHVIYRMNLFGNKQARQSMRNARRMGGDGGPGGFGGGGNRGGGGGFGGGGPM